MAKGFTVKAKKPPQGKETATAEWDYDKAKEMVKGKSIVFCLPGRGVSYTYLKKSTKKFSKYLCKALKINLA